MTSCEIGPGRCGLGQRGGASRSSRYRACASVDRPGRPRGCRDRPAAARDAPCAWSPGSRSGHPARRAGAARMACRGASRWLPLTSPLRPGSRCPRRAMHARTSKLASARARGAQDARLRPVDGPLGRADAMHERNPGPNSLHSSACGSPRCGCRAVALWRRPTRRDRSTPFRKTRGQFPQAAGNCKRPVHQPSRKRQCSPCPATHMRWLRAPSLVASRSSPFTGASVSPTLEAERDGLTPALGRGLLTCLRHLAGGLSAHVTGGNDRMYGPSEGRELSPSQLHSTASAMPAHGSPTSLGRLARQTCGNKLSRVRAGLRNARPRGISPGNWCRALCREGKQAGREQSRQACYARDGERGPRSRRPGTGFEPPVAAASETFGAGRVRARLCDGPRANGLRQPAGV